MEDFIGGIGFYLEKARSYTHLAEQMIDERSGSLTDEELSLISNLLCDARRSLEEIGAEFDKVTEKKAA